MKETYNETMDKIKSDVLSGVPVSHIIDKLEKSEVANLAALETLKSADSYGNEDS